jgi:hypothetical protein
MAQPFPQVAIVLLRNALKEASMADTWRDDETYWRENYRSRPYARGAEYDSIGGGYRYGYEAANRYSDREWDDVESDLERDWDAYEYRGKSTWQQVKDAVRDAWDRVAGRRTHAR